MHFGKTIELVLQPKEFSGGKFGYQASKPNQSVHFVVSHKKQTGRVMISCIGNVSHAPVSKAVFMKNAKTIKLSSLEDLLMKRLEFKTGSLGWHHTWDQAVSVAGHKFKVRMNLNVVLKGTKDEDHEHDLAHAPVPDELQHNADQANAGEGKPTDQDHAHDVALVGPIKRLLGQLTGPFCGKRARH